MATEKRLIDYDEIRRLFDAQYKETVQLIHDGETHLDNLADGFTEADRIIRKIPTVDAVEVVRCKDCKYYCQDKINGAICRHPELDYDIECYDHWINTNPDDFCSYGERKDGDGNG